MPAVRARLIPFTREDLAWAKLSEMGDYGRTPIKLSSVVNAQRVSVQGRVFRGGRGEVMFQMLA